MGVITRVTGTGTAGNTGDDDPATEAELNQPCGVAVTADGGFLIADTYNSVVRMISAAGIITRRSRGAARWGPSATSRSRPCWARSSSPAGWRRRRRRVPDRRHLQQRGTQGSGLARKSSHAACALRR